MFGAYEVTSAVDEQFPRRRVGYPYGDIIYTGRDAKPINKPRANETPRAHRALPAMESEAKAGRPQ